MSIFANTHMEEVTHGRERTPDLPRRVVSEFLGTAFLLAAIVGSGIMGERLAGGNVAIALLANTLATGAVLITLILTFGPLSGAHFNPLVSAVEAALGRLRAGDALLYGLAQIAGAIAGVAVAHAMFGESIVMFSTHVRSGPSQFLSEVVATFGLFAVILSGSRHRPGTIPFAVAAYIVSAYWFTASTSFANPAVTIARSLTNTFAGIRPVDVPLFVVAQIAGAAAATFCFVWLLPSSEVADTAETGRP